MMCERDSYRPDSISYRRHATEERNCYKYSSTVNSAQTHTSSTANNNQTMKAAMELSFSPVAASSMATTNNSTAPSAVHTNSSATSFNISTTSSSSSSTSSSSSSSSPAPQSSASIGVNLRVTGQCSQGGRKYMEDYFSVAYQQSEYTKDLEYAFVGIYDGHGGAEAATFAKEHLMMEIINQKLFWSDSDQDVLRAIREGYIATHYAMWREQDKWPKTATGLPSTAGTTATVAFIRREKIYIGHVGDSGIVLGYQNDNEHFWRAKQLTTDHKPESQAERSRIMRSGGKVVVKSGVPRVVWNRPRKVGHKGPVRRNTPVDEIPFLAVARSLGDLWSYNSERNEFIVSPDPDVKVIKINPKTFRCLIFGTDGLWNVVTPQEAVDSVREKELINERLQAQRGESTAEGSQGQWTNPSKGLVEKALRTWSSKKMRADNTSVVTVILYPPGTNIKDNTMNCHTHSYGLEYTQVNAEIPTHDDEPTYAEMANKYLPPEEYRNFKYDDDDDDDGEEEEEEEPDIDPLQTTYIPYSSMGYDSYQPSLASAHDYYDPLAVHPGHEEIIEAGDGGDDDEDDDDEEEEEEEDEDLEDANGFHKETAQGTNYTTELPICSSRVSVHAKLIEQDSLDYMNSFAESYTDSLLSGQMDNTDSSRLLGGNNSSLSNTSDSRCSDSTSSSSSSNSSSYHSSVYRHNQVEQHELIMEHQQYQELCMSQEEGYSLTKLETRGEQQMRNGAKESGGAAAAKEVQTFKIFQQHQQTSTDTYNAAAIPAEELYDIPPGKELFYDPRLPALVEFINSYKPKLELNSVLQQEMEEEQQVAMERLEMQRNAEQEQQPPAPLPQEPATELESESICEEYLEEEHLAPEELTTTSSALDESIQINEISSSIESPTSSSSPSSSCEEEMMEIDALDDDEVEMELKSTTMSPEKIVLLEKIEILQDKPELVIESTPSTVISVPPTLPPPPSAPPSTASLPTHAKVVRAKPYAKTHSKTFINPSPSKRSHFANVPNENQRLALPSCSSSASSLRGTCHVSSYDALLQQQQQQQQHHHHHQSPEKRQLRSTAPITVDYTKRTLRSRNSLSKDMKAKSTLNLRRSTSISSQYLRTTAASLLASSSSSSSCNTSQQTQQQQQQHHHQQHHHQQQQQQQQQQRQQRTNSTLRSSQKPNSPSHLGVVGCKPAVVTTSTPVLTSLPHAINLRSRQVVSAVANAAAAAATATVVVTPAVTIQSTQRRERRNLRSFSTKSASSSSSSSSAGGGGGKEQNFSKTTRLQSSVASLAAPPPSPKLICAATRGRSLLPSKTSVTSSSAAAAAAAADFSKRSTLRSGSLSASSGASVSATTLQTRSRVQKRLNR